MIHLISSLSITPTKFNEIKGMVQLSAQKHLHNPRHSCFTFWSPRLCMARCRSEMTKIFPAGNEPPEETVELWTGQKQKQQQQIQQHLTESRQKLLLRLLECLADETEADTKDNAGSFGSSSSRSEMNHLFSRLICLQMGTCQDEASTEQDSAAMFRKVAQCYDPDCSEKCLNSQAQTLCLKSCVQNANPFEFTLPITAPNSISKRETARMRLSQLREALGENVPQNPHHDLRGVMKNRGSKLYEVMGKQSKRNKFLHTVNRKTTDGLSRAEKRYRLGLYDCISSYCGQLSGTDRKSCIINYCHRSTTIKM